MNKKTVKLPVPFITLARKFSISPSQLAERLLLKFAKERKDTITLKARRP